MMLDVYGSRLLAQTRMMVKELHFALSHFKPVILGLFRFHVGPQVTHHFRRQRESSCSMNIC